MDRAPEVPLTAGLVTDVDEYAVTVLVGDAQEEWTFPRSLVPGMVARGDQVHVRFDEGRPIVVGRDASDENVELRLSRPINLRRLQLLAD